MEEKFINVSDMVEHIFDVMEVLDENGLKYGIYHETVELGDITLYLYIDNYGTNITNYDRDFDKANYIDKFQTTIFLNEGYEKGVEVVTEVVEAIKEEAV